jgi:hypothetical protein
MFSQDTITCSACSREWDGNAQCPCWLDDAYESASYEDPIRETCLAWKETSLSPCRIGQSTSLNKEQVRKGLFLQLGTQEGLPIEIIIYIYCHLKKSEKEDVDYIREYHAHNICNNIFNSISIYPINRGLEWGIDCTIRYPMKKITHTRKVINKFIEIIGKPDYLLGAVGETQFETQVAQPVWGDASLSKKLLYLKTSPVDEILQDFEDFTVYHGGIEQHDYRIYINLYGEGMFSYQ